MAMSAGTQIGRYEIVALLGAGGMGEVYRARDTRLERDIAVKVLPREVARDPERARRFEQEARAAGRLNHPNITTIYDVGAHDGVPYLVCELLDGETLGAALKRGPLPTRQAIDYAVQIARGLAAAHDVGVVHRDLKPENVFILVHGRVKVLDFGLAKLRGSDAATAIAPATPTATETLPGLVMGTAGYMAPEQVKGLPADHRCDIFALGTVLYEMLSGRRAFAGSSAVETMHQILTGEPPALAEIVPGLSPSLDTLVLRCLRKRPEQRFQSARDLGHALEALSASSGSGAGAAVLTRPRDNLPVSLSSFVGRERELDELPRLLARSRLLTLAGPGGCGKTRLAIEVARLSVDEFLDGVFLVELAPVAEPAVVELEVARTLDVRETSGERPAEAIARRVGDDRLLLVLDNCEHLIDAAAALAEGLLAACPRLAVLATSREPLRVTGEVVRQVPSLALPEADAVPGMRAASIEELLAYDAVRLFVDRATAVDAGFALGETNAADVVTVCHRLDGFPLALELAAARVPAMSVGSIVERLDDRFRLLTGGRRGALTRQQTLQATVDWSYDLLTDEQRTVFCRLAVFHGGFDMEAAVAVCDGSGIDPDAIAMLVGELVERSMVVADRGGAGVRYRLLETMRDYGVTRLREAGALDEARDRHSRWVVDLTEGTVPELAGPVRHEWLARLDAQRDDLRAAFDHLLASDPARAVRQYGLLWPYWMWFGYLGEGLRHIGDATARTPGPSLDRAEALLGAYALSVRWAGLPQSSVHLDAALAEVEAVGDDRATCRALWFDGVHHHLSDKNEIAERRFEAAHGRAREAGLPAEEASAIHALAVVAWAEQRVDLCEARLAEALARARALAEHGGALLMLTLGPMAPTLRSRDPRLMWEETWVPFQETSGRSAEAYLLANMGNMARGAGRLVEAERHLHEALAIYEAVGDESGAALAHCRLGQLALAETDFDSARRHLRKSLSIREGIGDARGVVVSLMSLGHCATQQGNFSAARDLLSRGEKLCRQRGDRPVLGAILSRRGVLDMLGGDTAAAVDRFRESVEIQRDLGVNLVTAAALSDLAEAYARAGLSHDAAAAVAEALPLFERHGYEMEADRCRRLLADLGAPPVPPS